MGAPFSAASAGIVAAAGVGTAEGARGVGVDVRAGVAAAAGDDTPLVWLLVAAVAAAAAGWRMGRLLGSYWRVTTREGVDGGGLGASEPLEGREDNGEEDKGEPEDILLLVVGKGVERMEEMKR